MILANVMFILNLQRKGRTVEMLRFKLFAKCHERKKTTTISFRIDSVFQSLFETTAKT
jgi:hypothetical protein